MIPTLTIRTAELSRGIDELIRRTGKEALEVVLDEGRLLEIDLVKLTPPFGSAPSSESYAAQRRIGEDAVKRDVERVFHVIDLSKIRRKEIRDRLELLIQQKDVEGIKALLLDCKIPVNDVIREASPALAAKFRDSRGRVRKPKWIWVLSQKSVDKTVKAVKAHVGQAKAGWAAAAQALGAKIPNWITRHGTGSGSFELSKKQDAPKIILRNNVPYIQTTGAELHIVERALKNRARNIKAKLEKIVRSGWRKKR